MEWKREWTRWGYTPDGVRRGVDRQKGHLLHQFGEAPGLNQAVFTYWTAHGVPRVRVICTDGGLFTALTQDLACHPKRRSVLYAEPQWAWPRSAWDFIHPGEEMEQLGLWG